jgi:hypothetical protein
MILRALVVCLTAFVATAANASPPVPLDDFAALVSNDLGLLSFKAAPAASGLGHVLLVAVLLLIAAIGLRRAGRISRTVAVTLVLAGLGIELAWAHTLFTSLGHAILHVHRPRPGERDFLPAERAQIAALVAAHHPAAVQVAEATITYNAHGQLFDARDSWINNDQVQQILDDDYVSEPTPYYGDLVVYRQDGAIRHAGVIVGMGLDTVSQVWGKWGSTGEYRHAPADVPAVYGTPSYFRKVGASPTCGASLDPIMLQACDMVLGNSTLFLPRGDACGQSQGYTCESRGGDVATDAMRTTYGVDFAITNSGVLRNDLTCPTTDDPSDFCPPYTPPPYPITRGQVLTVLPFGTVVVTLTVDGAELKSFLENGVSQMPMAIGRFAQVSGLCFTYDISAMAGSRVTAAVRQAADGSCTGSAIDLTAASMYTLAINDFMATGGDGYPNVSPRTTVQDRQDQVVADYIMANSPLSPAIQGRIVCTTGGAPPCPVVTP